ncbi:MAG: hypothetical protein ABI823_17245, partial [Bryobacteraceae bacterium]
MRKAADSLRKSMGLGRAEEGTGAEKAIAASRLRRGRLRGDETKPESASWKLHLLVGGLVGRLLLLALF